MKENHADFHVKESALMINPLHPHLGASPDAISFCANRPEGLSINTSKHSMMTAHDGKFSLKHIGIVSRRFSRSGQWTRKCIDEYMV